MNGTKKAALIIGGFMAGFLIGVVATSLLTPWSGVEAQDKLGLRELPVSEKLKKLKELVDEVEEELSKETESSEEVAE